MGEIVGNLAWVALGALIGGPLRYFISGAIARRLGETFPWGTLIVNVTGAFVIGAVGAAAAAHRLGATPAAWFFVVTGILGSYTTVSSFSLQTLALAHAAEYSRAAANIVASIGLSLAGVALGYAAALTLVGAGHP
jgi:fluoride exporter